MARIELAAAISLAREVATAARLVAAPRDTADRMLALVAAAGPPAWDLAAEVLAVAAEAGEAVDGAGKRC